MCIYVYKILNGRLRTKIYYRTSNHYLKLHEIFSTGNV